MGSLKFLLRGKSNNVKLSLGGDKVEVGIMTFHSKSRNLIKSTERQREIAINNKAEYFLTLLFMKDSIEDEMVFKRPENLIESEEWDEEPLELVGWVSGREIVPSHTTKVKSGSVGGIEFDAMVEHVNGNTDYYLGYVLVHTEEKKR